MFLVVMRKYRDIVSEQTKNMFLKEAKENLIFTTFILNNIHINNTFQIFSDINFLHSMYALFIVIVPKQQGLYIEIIFCSCENRLRYVQVDYTFKQAKNYLIWKQINFGQLNYYYQALKCIEWYPRDVFEMIKE